MGSFRAVAMKVCGPGLRRSDYDAPCFVAGFAYQIFDSAAQSSVALGTCSSQVSDEE